jgi:hypothetical protein
MRGIVVPAGLQILVGKSFRGLTLAQPKLIAGATRATKMCHQRCGQAVERVHGQSLGFLAWDLAQGARYAAPDPGAVSITTHPGPSVMLIGAPVRMAALPRCPNEKLGLPRRIMRLTIHPARKKRRARRPGEDDQGGKGLGNGRAASPACSRPAASSEAAAADGAGRLQHDRPEPRSCCIAIFGAPALAGQPRYRRGRGQPLCRPHKGLKAAGFWVEPARITLCVGRCLPPRQACSSGRPPALGTPAKRPRLVATAVVVV